MFRAYIPAGEAQAHDASIVEVHGRPMVCLAECPSLDELRREVADAWEGETDLLVIDPDGLVVSRG